jgi:hypothetical protein
VAAGGRKDGPPDPMGKRALFWVPGSGGKESHPAGTASGSVSESGLGTTVLPVGKRALYSGARAESHSVRETSGNPLAEQGTFVVHCEDCRQTSHVGVVDLLIFQFPFPAWLPRGSFDRRMTCPSCRKRTWCSVSLRRTP